MFKISIPYGAIKRQITLIALHILIISIPYGAIKSYILMNLIIMAMKFQFLMVRLKASVKTWLVVITNLFQFLMVRLKEVVTK